MKKIIVLLVFLFSILNARTENSTVTPHTAQPKLEQGESFRVYKLDIKEEIGPSIWRKTQIAFQKAREMESDLILIHMNTYGGMLISADSIRSIVLNSKIPVYVFIDNNAASAGALISIACKKIYMRKGANIGAATVVSQDGAALPDKYQSYMRSMMRATAEAHGHDTIIEGKDTTILWHRDPKIAEAMVDPSLYVEGVSDTGKVLTFTTEEAMVHGFCEGVAEEIEDVFEAEGIDNYVISEYKPTQLDKLIGFLINPIFQGILIMIIIGGLYFELQTPGIGFPLAASIVAAILYFAPLYLEGLAENWEVVIFIIGVVLLAVEIFAIPGFGVFGIAGISLMVLGLALSMVDNIGFEFSLEFLGPLFKSIVIVLVSMLISLILSIYFTKKAFDVKAFQFIALNTSESKEEGYIGVNDYKDTMTGKEGTAFTVLRPSGKIMIDDDIYDATSLSGFIEKDTKVKVMKYETGQLYVVKI